MDRFPASFCQSVPDAGAASCGHSLIEMEMVNHQLMSNSSKDNNNGNNNTINNNKNNKNNNKNNKNNNNNIKKNNKNNNNNKENNKNNNNNNNNNNNKNNKNNNKKNNNITTSAGSPRLCCRPQSIVDVLGRAPVCALKAHALLLQVTVVISKVTNESLPVRWLLKDTPFWVRVF